MDEAKKNQQNVDDLPAIRADESGMALLRAAGANDVHSVRQLLEKGTNPNMYEKYGRKTPLILAAGFGCCEVMNDLLEHRASICQTDRWGNTPLHCAAVEGHLNCVKFLLQHHSPLEVVNHRQCTPLMRAAMKGRTEIVRHLLDNNAIVSSQLNENKESALTLGCGSGKVDLVKLLLECGSPVADRSAELNAALREAVLFGRVELVQILLNHGANANHSDDTNSPVIFLSIDSNKVSILDLLIAHGANIEQLDGQDYTPLMKAAKTGKREMVAALLAAGANPKVRRKVDRKTALSLARSQGHKEICKIILKAKVKKTS